jgi:hypothetical protein
VFLSWGPVQASKLIIIGVMYCYSLTLKGLKNFIQLYCTEHDQKLKVWCYCPSVSVACKSAWSPFISHWIYSLRPIKSPELKCTYSYLIPSENQHLSSTINELFPLQECVWLNSRNACNAWQVCGSYNDVLNKSSMASGMDVLPIKPLNMTQLVNILQNIYWP